MSFYIEVVWHASRELLDVAPERRKEDRVRQLRRCPRGGRAHRGRCAGRTHRRHRHRRSWRRAGRHCGICWRPDRRSRPVHDRHQLGLSDGSTSHLSCGCPGCWPDQRDDRRRSKLLGWVRCRGTGPGTFPARMGVHHRCPCHRRQAPTDHVSPYHAQHPGTGDCNGYYDDGRCDPDRSHPKFSRYGRSTAHTQLGFYPGQRSQAICLSCLRHR